MIATSSKATAWISRLFGERPVLLAFWGSLLLSFISVMGEATVGRDAALYLDVAQQVSEHGPQVALKMFDWPWFSMLLAATHKLLGLPLELSAYLWCALFLAGASALMVDCVRRRTPEVTLWACLIVLAMPAVNSYRYDIIRECGFWFFCTLTFWQALRWQDRGGWLRAALIHLAICGAVLFRLEAALLWPALGLWVLPNLWNGRRKAFLQFIMLPVLGVALGLGAILASGGISSARVIYYLGFINPWGVVVSFNRLSDQFSSTLINPFSQDDVGQIIFFGLLAALMISFIKLMGPFCIPFLVRRNWNVWGTYWRLYRPFAWAALIYAVVLMLFFIRQQFLISRYVSFLNLLIVPAMALALGAFIQARPRMGKALVVIGLLVMLSNVISTSPGKPHFIEAGRWVAANTDPHLATYYEDGRISYYAGRGYVRPSMDREAALASGKYRYFLISEKPGEPGLDDWLAQHKLRVLASFSNSEGAKVLAIGEQASAQ